MFSERVKALRLARSISQVELAGALGVSKQTISNWENDNILPSIEMLMKTARYFSVTTDYLLGLEQRETLDVSGLSIETISHLRQIVNDLK